MMERYGLFSFGAFYYALPLLRLQKILHRYQGYFLPLLPDTVSEVLVDVGCLVPLVCLPAQHVGEGGPPRTAAYKVIVESEAGLVAFPADEACGIVAKQKGEVVATSEEWSAGIAEVFKYQGKEYPILDIDFLAFRMTQKSDKIA